MTDDVRARLERAKEHPAYREAMGREPADYTVPALVLGLLYLLPIAFVIPFVLATPADAGAVVIIVSFAASAIWAIPFLVVAVKLLRLRRLPVGRWLGVVSAEAPAGRPGHWVRLERLDEPPIDLRLRIRAYIESTGGATAPGKIGVAMCRGDQMVEWVLIPDRPDAPPA